MIRDLGFFIGGALFALVSRPLAKKAYEKTSEWRQRRREAKVEAEFKQNQQKKAEVAGKVINLSELGLDLNQLVSTAQGGADVNNDSVLVIGKEEFSKLLKEAKTEPTTPVAK